MPVYDDPRAGEAAAVRLARGEAVQGVLDGDDPRAWLALDAGVRRAAWWCAGAQRAEWERVAPLPDDPAGLDAPRYALALCHRDGRVREAAVRGVAAHPSLLPLLVVRAADWGAPVRQAARQVLRELVDGDAVGEGGPGTVVGLAPVILLVGRRERGAFGVALLNEVLRDPSRAWPPALLSHGYPAVRRHVHRLAVGTGRLSPPSWPAPPPMTRTRSSSPCARTRPWPPCPRAGPARRSWVHCSRHARRGPGRPG